MYETVGVNMHLDGDRDGKTGMMEAELLSVGSELDFIKKEGGSKAV